jgi:hypothetical protein
MEKTIASYKYLRKSPYEENTTLLRGCSSLKIALTFKAANFLKSGRSRTQFDLAGKRRAFSAVRTQTLCPHLGPIIRRFDSQSNLLLEVLLQFLCLGVCFVVACCVFCAAEERALSLFWL